MKPPTTLNGHRGALRRPKGARFLNYEGEVAVVVGTRMHGVPQDTCSTTSPGYAVANDVGLHDFRHADRGSMLRVKGQDGFCPIGPELVPASEFDPTELRDPHLPERRGRPAGVGRRPDLADQLPARRPLPPDHARAGRRRPHRHARQLAADGAGRRGRGRGRPACGRLSNTVVDWDVDLSGPGDQLQVSANTLHVALAMPEDEAERAVAEGACRDLAAAHRPRLPARRRPGRGDRALGHPVRADRGRARRPPRVPALRLRAVLAGAGRARRAGPRPHRLRAAARRLAGRRGRATSTTTASSTRTATARCSSPTPTATASSSMPHRDDDDRRPGDRPHRLALPGFRPRKLGHVNLLTGRHGASRPRFYTDVLGHAGGRLARRRRHLVPHQRRAPPDGAGRQDAGRTSTTSRSTTTTGATLRRRVRPPRPARPLARLGAGAPRASAQNICGYVRITEEPLLVECYCRHGAARAPTTSRASGPTTASRRTPGGRCRRARTSASTTRPSATSATASRCSARSSHP